MNKGSPSPASLLAIDIGTVSTQAILFDIVKDKYRFIARATMSTTAGALIFDVREGVRMAINRLQDITGYELLETDGSLILPRDGEGHGVDSFVATLSAGPPLKVMTVGLLDDVSLESAKRLAATTYSNIVKTFSVDDKVQPEERIDAILRIRPDLIIVAGGTDGGASRSVCKIAQTVGLALSLIPEEKRPDVIYAGNNQIVDKIKSLFGPLATISHVPNIRPAIDRENIYPAQNQLAKIVSLKARERIGGLNELTEWSGYEVLPIATSFGQIIQFLSKVYEPTKGVLGIDVGSSATVVAASFAGKLSQGVYPKLGLGDGLINMLQQTNLESITRWLPFPMTDLNVRDYLYNKTIYPASLPVTDEELAIEHAITRQLIDSAIKRSLPGFPKDARRSAGSLLPYFEPILVSGSVFAFSPLFSFSMLMLLDGLQPTGVTTVILDQNSILPVLGAASQINPLLAIQILESDAFLNLGTVISPVGRTKYGTHILNMNIVTENGKELDLQVKFGSLTMIPLHLGQKATVKIQTLHHFDVGLNGSGVTSMRVIGGKFGLIVDARGRPLQLPEDDGMRRELLIKWQGTFGKI